jgi:hypothetical protein
MHAKYTCNTIYEHDGRMNYVFRSLFLLFLFVVGVAVANGWMMMMMMIGENGDDE